MDEPLLLWHSNAPFAPTGYGVQTALMVPRIMDTYNVRVSAFYGLEAAPLVWNGIKVLPGIGQTFGMETLPYHVQAFFGSARGGTIVTLMDVWVLDSKLCQQFDTVCWLPVDHEPAPPMVQRFLRQSGAIPIAMSRNGQDLLQEWDALYCPHAVDTNVYKPMGRGLARYKLGLPQDAFIIGQVGANKGNPSRKSFTQVIEAFAEFHRRHENSILYMYTDITGEFSNGVAFTPLLEQLRVPEEAIKFPDPYYIHFHPNAADNMALLYSAFDLLANPSAAEGFGIPLIESQACGTPVLATDFTAMREVAKVGWKVDGVRTWTAQHSWQAVPKAQDILAVFEKAYALNPERKKRMADEARKFAMRYDADAVATNYMLPALEQARERLRRRREVVKLKRAA